MEVIASSLYLTDKEREERHKEQNHWRRTCAEVQSLKQIALKKEKQHSTETFSKQLSVSVVLSYIWEKERLNQSLHEEEEQTEQRDSTHKNYFF